MEPIEGSETSAFRTQTPGNYPKENILHIEHGENLKSRNRLKCCDLGNPRSRRCGVGPPTTISTTLGALHAAVSRRPPQSSNTTERIITNVQCVYWSNTTSFDGRGI